MSVVCLRCFTHYADNFEHILFSFHLKVNFLLFKNRLLCIHSFLNTPYGRMMKYRRPLQMHRMRCLVTPYWKCWYKLERYLDWEIKGLLVDEMKLNRETGVDRKGSWIRGVMSWFFIVFIFCDFIGFGWKQLGLSKLNVFCQVCYICLEDNWLFQCDP